MSDTITVYITCGLPGSGKTTWAREFIKKNPGTVRVCRDNLREMFCGEYRYDKEFEALVKRTAINTLDLSIKNRHNVIIDETNIKKEKRADWIDIISMIDKEADEDGTSFITRKIKIQIVYFPLGIEVDSISGLAASFGDDNLENRMSDNPRGYSREHWRGVIESMKKDFEVPELSEFPEGTKIVEVN